MKPMLMKVLSNGHTKNFFPFFAVAMKKIPDSVENQDPLIPKKLNTISFGNKIYTPLLSGVSNFGVFFLFLGAFSPQFWALFGRLNLSSRGRLADRKEKKKRGSWVFSYQKTNFRHGKRICLAKKSFFSKGIS